MNYKDLENDRFVRHYDWVESSGLKPTEKIVLDYILSWRRMIGDRELKFATVIRGMNQSMAFRAKKGLLEKGFITDDLHWTGKREISKEEKQPEEVALEYSEELIPYYDRLPKTMTIPEGRSVVDWNEDVRYRDKCALENKKNGIKRR